MALPRGSHPMCSSDMEGELCPDIGLPPDQATCIDANTYTNNRNWPCSVGRAPTVTQQVQENVREENELDQLAALIRRELGGGQADQGQEDTGGLLEVGVTGSDHMLQGCSSHFQLAETTTVPYVRYQQAKQVSLTFKNGCRWHMGNKGSSFILQNVFPLS